MTRLISLAVLIAIIIIIGLLFYKVLIGFFVPVFLAVVLVVVFRPLHDWVLSRTGHRHSLAATLTTLLIMLALFLPVTVVGISAAIQGLKLIEQNDAKTVMLRINKVRDSLGLRMPDYKDELRHVETQLKSIIDETEKARDPSDMETLLPQLERLAGQTVTELEQLKEAVHIEWGPRWDTAFDELLAMLARLEAEPGSEETIDEMAITTLAVDLRTGFANLKTNLLGGSFMALARQTANPTNEDVEQLTRQALEYAQPRLLSITGATGAFVINFVFGSVILVVAIFFFLYDGPSMIQTIMRLSPLDDAYERELLLEFDRISRAVVLATLLSAVAQGVTAGIGYVVAGMDFLVLLTMLTTIFAMVPFVGPGVVWVPVCLYLGLYEERYLAATLLATWGILVVGTVDNIVKAFVLHGQSQLHPLLALLSVLGGVQTLGPIGIVVGPMVVVMLQTLLSILQRELVRLEGDDFSLSSTRGKPRARSKRQAAVNSDSLDSDSPDSDSPDSESPDSESTSQESPTANESLGTKHTLAASLPHTAVSRTTTRASVSKADPPAKPAGQARRKKRR